MESVLHDMVLSYCVACTELAVSAWATPETLN